MPSRLEKSEAHGPETSDDGACALEDSLERIVNLLGTERRRVAMEHELKEVQLRALDYLIGCNRFSDTPLALAEFLGTTKGTVSQTVGTLESKGLLKKVKDEVDGRVVHLRVTNRGRETARGSYPLPLLTQAIECLPTERQEALATSLNELLRSLQRASEHRSFGACHSCRHLQTEEEQFRCGLTSEPLLIEETRLICREHERPE